MSLWQPLQALTSGGSAPRSHDTAGINGDVLRLDGAQTAGSSPRSGGLGPHGRQRAGLDVVDVAVHRDAIGDERALPDRPHILADTVLQVAKGHEVDVGRVNAGLRRELAAQLVVGEREHPAVGVVDHEVLTGAEQLRGDDEAAQRVVGGAPAGVAHHMRIADLEAEEALRMEPGVHAGQDSNPAGRRHRLARLIEVGGVAAVVVEQDLSGAHDGSFYPFEWLAWWLAI